MSQKLQTQAGQRTVPCPVAASVAVGNSFGKVVVAGFNGAKGAIKEELASKKEKAKTNEGTVAYANVDTAELVEEA